MQIVNIVTLFRDDLFLSTGDVLLEQTTGWIEPERKGFNVQTI